MHVRYVRISLVAVGYLFMVRSESKRSLRRSS